MNLLNQKKSSQSNATETDFNYIIIKEKKKKQVETKNNFDISLFYIVRFNDERDKLPSILTALIGHIQHEMKIRKI